MLDYRFDKKYLDIHLPVNRTNSSKLRAQCNYLFRIKLGITGTKNGCIFLNIFFVFNY